MNLFKHWFQRALQPVTSESSSKKVSKNGSRLLGAKRTRKKPLHSVLGNGTRVTIQQLIGLQAQARKLDLSQSSYARASTTGTHRSRFRGRGMDYQESRVYQAGDDIRSMDWRVTARAGKPHTKLYQEERERPVMLLLDFNPGMFFGSRKVLKSVQAAKVAALLGWAAAMRGDRVGALIIHGKAGNDNHNHKELAPKSGKRGALQLIRELVAESDPQRGLQSEFQRSNLNEELKRLRRISRPGSLIVIISDFYHVDEETGKHLLRLSHHNDLIAIQIVDPLELQAPPAGYYGVTDGKQTGVLNTFSRTGKQTYNDFFMTHHKAVADLMKKRNIPLVRVSTTDEPTIVLQQVFGTAKRRSSMKSRVA